MVVLLGLQELQRMAKEGDYRVLGRTEHQCREAKRFHMNCETHKT